MEKPPGEERQNRRKFQSLARDARVGRLACDPTSLYIPQCRNVEVKNHPEIRMQFLKYYRSVLENVFLTSKDVRQNQQNTCLHLLHIIWAQPASLSIGT